MKSKAKTNALWTENKAALKVFLLVCEELVKYDIQSVSDESGVSTAALYFWLDGTTMLPQSRTLFKVAPVVGVSITAKKIVEFKGKKSRHLKSVK